MRFPFALPLRFSRRLVVPGTCLATLFLLGMVPADAGEINLEYNGTKIFNNDDTPSTGDGTFFGVIPERNGQTLSRTFTIENTADYFELLNFTGTPRVRVEGEHADEFTVTSQPDSVLFGGTSTTFEVTFTPVAGGIRNAILSIPNNDSNENPYSFHIQATVKYALNYSAAPNGTITGASTQNVWSNGSEVTAVPNPGYYFVGWSDGVRDNPRQDFGVTEDLSVSAHYFAYTSDGSEIVITDCDTGLTGALTVPGTINGLPVTSIGSAAFEGCSGFSEIILPESITSIGNNAFKSCTGLTGLTIPDAVTSIGDGAFYNCRNLTSLKISTGLLTIGHSAFYGCLKLTGLALPNEVTSIGHSAFYNCTALATLNLPDSLLTLGHSAFYRCSKLTSLTIPNGVTAVEYRTFFSCVALSEITIPDGLLSVGSAAFRGCYSLTNIVLPESVIRIDNGAFEACESLTSITLPATLPDDSSALGRSVFSGCHALKSVTLPSGLTEIPEDTFSFLRGLENVVLPNGIWGIPERAFSGCVALTGITIPDSVSWIEDGAFYRCESLTSIIIPDNVTSMGYDVFYNCTNLESITLSNRLGEIPSEAFSNCTNLDKIIIPNSVTSIYYGAFRNCSSLSSIVIPDSVLYLDSNVFSGCTNLASVLLSAKLTTISSRTFYECQNLGSITIPQSVTSIEYEAFMRCSILEAVTFEGDAPTLDDFAFDEIAGGATAIIQNPYASGYSYGYSFGGLRLSGLSPLSFSVTATEVTITDCSSDLSGPFDIPETIEGLPVTAIGERAFYYCRDLTSITIPSSIVSIGHRAFEDCYDLETIILKGNAPSLGGDAFRDIHYNARIVADDPEAKGFIYGGTYGDLPVSGLNPNADPYRTGVSNLMTYAFFGPDRDPSTVSPSELPKILPVDGSLRTVFTPPSNVSGVTYSAEWTSTLGDSWQDLPDADAEPDVYEFSVPIDEGSKFMRLKVTEQ